MTSPDPMTSRRGWLRGAAAGLLLAPRVLARDDDPLDLIRAKGRAAGLGGFEVSESANYRGIGDASPRFQKEALGISESVEAEYRRHFAEKGFTLTRPAGKLTVVILASPQSYAAFEKGFVDQAVGGHYDLETNRLVMFDASRGGPRPGVGAAVPEVDNTLALVHETIHQLTFNTGVLDLKADVPLCVSEGLATYGETWRPNHKGGIGATNQRRLLGLKLGAREGAKWIPLARLLADDKVFEDAKEQQVAYAECWLFASKLLKDKARLPKFRDYLAALKDARDPGKRVELATMHLGDLARLDRAIRA